MGRAMAATTVRPSRKVVEELYDASLRVAGVVETLEVLTDKQSLRRIKLGEKEYARRLTFISTCKAIRVASYPYRLCGSNWTRPLYS